MHILLVNDDGYHADGIRCLARVLTDNGHCVTVAAPDRERSAVSHAISITPPLRAREIRIGQVPGWAIDGTPADCARLGLYLLRHDKPDICVSGINRGPNLGGACIYSGTVNSAMEASMAGCPAIASSLDSFTSSDYEQAARLTLEMCAWALAHPLRRGEIYNLNVPADTAAKGVYFTQVLAPEFLTDVNYQEFVSDYNTRYYFLDDGPNTQPYPENSDAVMCAKGWATVSVLTWDISARRSALPDEGELRLTARINK